LLKWMSIQTPCRAHQLLWNGLANTMGWPTLTLLRSTFAKPRRTSCARSKADIIGGTPWATSLACGCLKMKNDHGQTIQGISQNWRNIGPAKNDMKVAVVFMAVAARLPITYIRTKAT
jgi:hypothetical protein